LQIDSLTAVYVSYVSADTDWHCVTIAVSLPYPDPDAPAEYVFQDVTLYVDGQNVASGTMDKSITQTGFYIGGLPHHPNWADLQGYMDEYRFSMSAMYTGNFTVPTAPFTTSRQFVKAGTHCNHNPSP
jgi:hypothetical protein